MRIHPLFAIVALGAVLAVQAGSWEVPGIFGNAPGAWKEGRNWKPDAANPMTDNGAQWGLYWQSEPEAEFKPLVSGLAYKYHYVWRESGDSFDPACFYKETTLVCPGGKVAPGAGPAAVVTFTPAAPGSFKVDFTADVWVQSPTAGNARVRLVVLDAAQKVLREVKSLDLKAKDQAVFAETVELKAGEALGVTVQSINPGPGSCGRSSIAIKKFMVSQP